MLSRNKEFKFLCARSAADKCCEPLTFSLGFAREDVKACSLRAACSLEALLAEAFESCSLGPLPVEALEFCSLEPWLVEALEFS